MYDWADNLAPVDLADPVNRQHPLAQGLMAWWLTPPGLDGGHFWYDLLGQFSGTLQTGTVWARPAGAVWSALNFPSGNGVATNLKFAPPFTFLWLCVVPYGNNLTVFSYASGSYECLFGVGSAAMGQLGFGPTAAVSTDWSVAPTTQAIGSVHHYGLGYDGTTATWWVDGQMTGTTTPAKQNTTTVTSLRLGARANNSLPLTTRLDSFMAYRRVLANSDVLAIYGLSQQGYPGVLNRRAQWPWSAPTGPPPTVTAYPASLLAHL